MQHAVPVAQHQHVGGGGVDDDDDARGGDARRSGRRLGVQVRGARALSNGGYKGCAAAAPGSSCPSGSS